MQMKNMLQYQQNFLNYKQILLLFICILFFNLVKCLDCNIKGCNICESQNNNLCNKCQLGFDLTNEKQCKNSKCIYKQYSQDYVSNSKLVEQQCVSICNSNELANSIINTCDTAVQCSNTFIQKSQTNKSRNILFILQIYDTFVNAIDSTHGSFKRTFQFADGVSTLNVLDNKLYLLNIVDKTILEWDPYESSSKVISQITDGDLKPSSQIFKFSNGQRYAISTFDQLNSKIYLSEISISIPKSVSFDIIDLPSVPDKIYTFNNIILQQKSNDFKIKITQVNLIEQTAKKIILNQQDYLCNDVKGQIIDSVEYIDSTSQYFIIFNNTKSIYNYIKQSGIYQCQNTPTDNFPKQIKIIQLNTCQISYLIIKFDNNQIKSYLINKDKLLEQFTINADSNIEDFISIANQNIVIYLITSSGTLLQYQINLNCRLNLQISYDTKLINSQPVILKSPIKFYQFQLFEENESDKSGALLTSFDTQLILPSLKNTAILIRDFQDKVFKNEASVSKIIYMEFYHFIVSCSIEGKIIVWKAIDPLSPKYLYSIWRLGVCRDILEFKDQYVIALFSKEILIFNVFNSQLMKSYPIKIPTKYDQISVTNNYIYLFYDVSGFVLNAFDNIVASSQNKTFPNQFQNYQQIFVPQTDKIIIYTLTFELILYEFDANLGIIQGVKSYSYQNPKSIFRIKLFNLKIGGFHIVFYDEQSLVRIFGQTLNLLNMFPIYIGLAFAINSFEQYYIFNLKLFDNTKINQFTLLFLDTTTNEQIYVGKFFIIAEFVQFQLRKNNLNQDTIIGVNWMPIQYTSFTAQFMWVPSIKKDDVPFARFTYSPQQTTVNAISDKQKSVIITGNVSGEVRVTPTPLSQRDLEVVFTSPSTNPEDEIKFINHSTILEKYFIVTNVVYCYSIYTDIIIETIEFQVKQNLQSIKGFYISEKRSLLIAYIPTEIIVRDFSSGKAQNSYQFTNTKELKNINGFYFDELTSELFIYGNQLVRFSSNLEDIYIINQKDQQLSDFYNCIFVDEIISCNVSNQKLVIYSRSTVLFPLIATAQATESNFKIVTDTQNKYILIYYKMIQVYSYTGTLIVSISNFSSDQIKSITYFDNFFVVQTAPLAIIFNSLSLKQIGSFTAPGGQLNGIIYLKDLKLIGYYSEELRSGQIIFQNTDNFQPAGFIVNTYDQVGIGRIIKIIYDIDSLMLNYFDEFGNNQNILMSTKTIDNTFSIEEIQQGGYKKPEDYLIDFKTNSLLAHNRQRVWKMNYNIHTRQARQFSNRPTNHFFIIDNTSNSERKFLVSDYKNTLFLYKDFEIIFFAQFNKDILYMGQIQNQQQLLYLIFYSQEILVFKNYQNLTQEKSSTYTLNTYAFKKVMLIDQNKLILNTIDNQIVDYDYFNNMLTFSVKLDILDDITTTLVIGSQSEKQWLLFYGTESGKVGFYDINIPNHQIKTLENSPPITKILQMNKNIIVIIDIKGQVNMIDISNLDKINQQSMYDSLQSKIKTENQLLINQQNIKNIPEQNKKIQIYEIDIKNQRYFVNYFAEKKLGVWNLKDFSFIKYIQFPDDQWKQIVQNDQFIILACSYQLNIYTSNNLKFLTYIRRYNRKDRITDLRLVDTNKVIEVFNTRIEILFIIQERNEIQMVEQISLTDPKLIFLQIDQNENQLILVGVSKESIFEKRLSLGIKEQQIQANINKKQNFYSCYSIFQFENQAQIQNQYDQIYDPTVLNIKYLIQVKLYHEIRSFNSINKSNSQIILRPQDIMNNFLNIRLNSFIDMNFDLQFDGFNFKFIEQTDTLKTNSQSKNIIFQNIVIENQSIQQKMSILIDNKDQINLQNIVIKNITIKSSVDNSNKVIGKSGAFINILKSKNVYIQNLQIQDCNFQSIYEFFLISASQVDNLHIKELTISNSSFDSIFRISQSKKVTIQTLNIYNSNSTNFMNNQYDYIFQFIGVINLELSDIKIKQNKNILLFNTLNYFQQDGTIIYLTEDTFSLFDAEITDNIFDDNQHIGLFSSESSYVNITSLKYQKNQGNIFMKNNKNVLIQYCVFDENSGINGGSIQVEELSYSLKILNTTFSNNTVLASGGAIYLKNIQNFSIDKKSQIINNTALIGGGIRILNQNVNLEAQYINDSNMTNNIAEIFGNNTGSYLENIEIYTLKNKTESQIKDITINDLQQEFKGRINDSSFILNDIQSGGNLPIYIKLADKNGNPMQIEQAKFKKNRYLNSVNDNLNITVYHDSVINELNSIQLEFQQLSSQNDTNDIDIKGETVITLKQYNFQLQMLLFSSLTVSSAPLTSYVQATLKVTYIMSNQNQLNTFVNFRKCERGEVIQYTMKNIYSLNQTTHQIPIISCQKCSFGTFSLFDPMTELTSDVVQKLYDRKQISFSTCKKCPTSYCQGDIIQLDVGYWRENKYSDEIIKCNKMNSQICNEKDEKSKDGCIEGYIGPLCETCDSTGRIWKGKRFTSSLQDYKCLECSSNSYQISFIAISIICLFLYLFCSTVLFMNRYIYHSSCYYLRLMNMLPFSQSCTLDSSSYFVKTLINYLQISTLLYTQNINLTPSFLNIIPNTTSKPSSQIIVSSECLYGLNQLQKFGIEHIRAYSIAFFPITLSIILYIIFQICSKYKISQISHFHKYTMLNVVFLFFQPDCIGFFTKALSCRKIGQQSYQQINNLILCSDPHYNTFRMYFILPNLVFWSLVPAIIFLFIRRNKGNNYEKLNYCTTKFRYGYFYLEYKKQYYYWEIIRSYFKILLVLIAILLNDINFNMLALYILLIFLYAISVMIKKPFQSQHLNELEISTFLVLIPCIFSFQIYQNSQIMIFQIFTIIIHYGYLSYLILLIAKIKINNQSNHKFYKVLRKALKSVCPSYIIKSFLKQKSESSKSLMKWRFLYRKIKQIKELQNQQIESQHLQSLAPQEIQTLFSGRDLFMRNKMMTQSFYDVPQNMNKKKSVFGEGGFPTSHMLMNDSHQDQLIQNKHMKTQMSIFRNDKSPSKRVYTEAMVVNEVQSIPSSVKIEPKNIDLEMSTKVLCISQSMSEFAISPHNLNIQSPSNEVSQLQNVYDFKKIYKTKF